MKRNLVVYHVLIFSLLIPSGLRSQSIQFAYQHGKRVTKTVGLSLDKEIVGDTLVSDRCTHQYAIPDFPDHQYIWEVQGGEILEGQNTAFITVLWEASGTVLASEIGSPDQECVGTYALPVIVEIDTLTAEFQADTLIGYTPLPVQFTEQVVGLPDSYLWDFGDGATSTESNPYHEYGFAGIYTVALTVVKGCDTTMVEKIDYIEVIELTDTANAPTASDEAFYLDENASPGTLVGTVKAIDPNGDGLTFVISAGNELQAFEMRRSRSPICFRWEVIPSISSS
jgi:hypothetical protein